MVFEPTEIHSLYHMAQLQMDDTENTWLHITCFVYRLIFLFSAWSGSSKNVWRQLKVMVTVLVLS